MNQRDQQFSLDAKSERTEQAARRRGDCAALDGNLFRLLRQPRVYRHGWRHPDHGPVRHLAGTYGRGLFRVSLDLHPWHDPRRAAHRSDRSSRGIDDSACGIKRFRGSDRRDRLDDQWRCHRIPYALGRSRVDGGGFRPSLSLMRGGRRPLGASTQPFSCQRVGERFRAHRRGDYSPGFRGVDRPSGLAGGVLDRCMRERWHLRWSGTCLWARSISSSHDSMSIPQRMATRLENPHPGGAC